MLSDLGICRLLSNLYDDQKSFDYVANVDGVCAGLKYFPTCTLVAFRGSTTFLDWIRDFQAIMVYTDDIGGVDMGFYMGLRRLYAQTVKGVPSNKPVYIAGHSLGGGRAYIFAAMMVKAGFDVRVVTFGAPRPGDAQLKAILSTATVTAYKNGNDYITDVPIPIHPLLPYEHPAALLTLNEAPPEDDRWGVLRYHHLQLYQQALEKKDG